MKQFESNPENKERITVFMYENRDRSFTSKEVGVVLDIDSTSTAKELEFLYAENIIRRRYAREKIRLWTWIDKQTDILLCSWMRKATNRSSHKDIIR